MTRSHCGLAPVAALALAAASLGGRAASASPVAGPCATRWIMLVHSPLVGPSTWTALSATLRARGYRTLVPVLPNPTRAPFWTPQAQAIAAAADSVPPACDVILVAHSGAGALLAAARLRMTRRVAAYVFLDATVPENDTTRLLAMQAGDTAFARQLEHDLRAGHRFPEWTDRDLREDLPDSVARAAVLRELRPQPLAFFEEPIPGFRHGPDAPCVYLRFTDSYGHEEQWARTSGCAVGVLPGPHFLMLVAPDAVADRLFLLLDDARRSFHTRP